MYMVLFVLMIVFPTVQKIDNDSRKMVSTSKKNGIGMLRLRLMFHKSLYTESDENAIIKFETNS